MRLNSITAEQLSIMLSGLSDTHVYVKNNLGEHEIIGIEVGINENQGKTYIICDIVNNEKEKE